ncbi:MAG: LVIVD repeat-containing protein [Gemmatimonadota bacterium]
MTKRTAAGRIAAFSIAAGLVAVSPVWGAAQSQTLPARSPNVEVLSHIPLGAPLTVSDVAIEQELSRPFAYVGRMQGSEKGFDIIDLRDPRNAKRIYRWRIENVELHQGLGGMDPKYFKYDGRYYLVQSTQFFPGGPDGDVGAIVFDVTGLPDVSKVKEVGRLRAPETPVGFHNIFIYKHSDGRVLLFTTVSAPRANVYDLGRFVKGDRDDVLVATIPLPDNPLSQGGSGSYHDLYVGYHPPSGQDRFYGGGTGGYYVFDASDLENPKLIASITGANGINYGHTFTPTPDGRYAVAETEYQYAPLRIFDLKPALDGEVATITQPIAAWTADWHNLSHNHEVRWPYVFVSGYEDGLQVFNMMDPRNPVTVGYYDTYLGPHKTGMCSDKMCNGAFGVDVRNADGLIVVSDMSTGFWAFRLEGFQGWNGEGWGMPDISSVQNWEEGPVVAAER